jgi:inorganic pyrophosphatase
MASNNLTHLAAWDAASGALNIVIETPKGSRNKYKYDAREGRLELCKVLPRGMSFPFDFGFIPSTLSEDGDPLDVLIFMDEPAVPGCCIAARLIGVIEAKQTKQTGEVIRNDRLVAVAEQSHDHKSLESLKQIHDHLTADIESFFASYHRLEGGDFKLVACYGPNKAEKLVQSGVKQFRKGSSKSNEHHGKPQRRKKGAADQGKSQANGKKKARKG